jgi:hypothetical protein
MGSLGFFHPSASGDWQKDRRYYGLRQDIQVPARVPENMYAEHVMSLERPVYIYFNAALTSCAGVVELPLAHAGIYEFELAVGPEMCKPRLFSLVSTSVSNPRAEVALSPPTTGFACTL